MATKRKLDLDIDSTEAQQGKTKIYKVSFRQEYTREFPCIVMGKNPSLALCKLCDHEFRLDHSGRDDCRKHVNSVKHKKKLEATAQVKPITSFMSTNNSVEEAVTRAEALLTSFLIEHNMALSASDHASKLFRSMFLVPGINPKEILEKYACSRTKTTAIVNELAKDARKNLIEMCKASPFDIATDGSNDTADKLYPLVIRYATPQHEVKTELLSLLNLTEPGTGENIAKLIHAEFSALDIPWKNCLSLCTDDANTMIGSKSGLYGQLLKINENLFSTGCFCHRLHLAAEWEAKELQINPDSFFVDIYYKMDKSASRIQNFKLFQKESNTEVLKIPKHVPTRWLSLGKVIKWSLQQWKPLTSFFKQECTMDKATRKDLGDEETKKQPNRKRRVLENLESRVTKLNLLYLNFIIPLFDRLNMKLQADEPLIHRQRRMVQGFIRELMVMIIKPCAMAHKDLVDVDLSSSYNYKPAKEIPIGGEAKEYIVQSKLPVEKINTFYASVKSFVSVAVKYLLKNMRLNDPLLMNAEVADINLRQVTSFSKLEYFLKRFPILIPNNSSIDEVQSEFSMYQCEDLSPSIEQSPRADEQWKAIGDIVDFCGDKKFKILPGIMTGILTIPHSNSESERVFSLVKRNRTDFRGNLSVTTLQSLLVEKQQRGTCYDQTFSKDLLKRLKSATSLAVAGQQQ